jgi:predicted SAM-dependent methyltransferase
MSDLWPAVKALYLSRVRGFHRVQRILDRFRRQRIPDEVYASPKKLNLGSSDRLLPTYINVDAVPNKKPDIVCDASRLTFARDNEYDLVRASHICEHFAFEQLFEVLAEWRRVLRAGGYLIVCVPNFRALAWRAILQPSGYDLNEITYANGWITGMFAVGTQPEFGHKIVFTRKSLADVLKRSGFELVGELDYRKEHPFTLGIADNSCSPFSLNVAAIKR